MNFLDTIQKYCSPVHRWNSSINNSLLVDVVGENHGSLNTGIVQQSGGLQGDFIDYSAQVHPSLNGGINCGAIPLLNDSTQRITILGIANVFDKATGNIFFCKWLDDNNCIFLKMDYLGTLTCYFAQGGVVAYGAVGATDPLWPVNKQILFAVVINPSGAENADRLKIFTYNKFRPIAFTGTIVGIPNTGNAPFRLGMDMYSGYLNGTLDEVMIINDTLNEIELQRIAAAIYDTKYYLCIGQSNCVILKDSTIASNEAAFVLHHDTEFNLIHLESSAAGRSIGQVLTETMVTALGCGICLIDSAFPGVGLVPSGNPVWGLRNESNHADMTTVYGRSLTMALLCDAHIDGIICINGETDAEYGFSAEAFMSYFKLLHHWLEEDIGYEIPLIFNIVGCNPDNTNLDEAALPEIRKGQAMSASSRMIPFNNAITTPLLESWHYTLEGYQRVGLLAANCLLSIRIPATYRFGLPQLILHDGNVWVHTFMGDDFVSEDYAGFEGKTADGAWHVPILTTRLGSRLVFAFNEGVGAIVEYRYLWENNPDFSDMVRDNGALLLPASVFVKNISEVATTIRSSQFGF
jgi:hypothetical protein